MRAVPYLPDVLGDLLLYLAGGYLSSDSDHYTFAAAQEERGGAGGTERLSKACGFQCGLGYSPTSKESRRRRETDNTIKKVGKEFSKSNDWEKVIGIGK